MDTSKIRSKRTIIGGIALVAALGAGGTVWATAANADGRPDPDDRVLSAEERTSAENAARTALPGGTVLEAEASDDQGVAYEVEVRDAAGQEWDVDLDSSYQVVTKTADTDEDGNDD